MVVMKRVDCEGGCASFILSFLSLPLFFVKRVSRYYGVIGFTIKLSQTLSILTLAAAQLWGEGAAVTVGAEIFLYLDC